MAKKDSQEDVLDVALDAFKGLSVLDQQEYIKQLQALAEEKRQGEIARLKEQLAALGVSMAPPPAIRKPRTPGDGERVRASPAAKYRSKKDLNLTWSGRGRMAKFLEQEMQETGQPLEAFLIDK